MIILYGISIQKFFIMIVSIVIGRIVLSSIQEDKNYESTGSVFWEKER